MHIGIDESSVAGPGDCHIKGGYVPGTDLIELKSAADLFDHINTHTHTRRYVSGTETWTVKLACVSFYKNIERGLPPGSGQGHTWCTPTPCALH